MVFKCKAWLDATSGDGKLERNFYPLTDCSYKIELQTSDLRGAGTSANGVISLLGRLAEAGPFQLANDGKTFQRGSLDVMTLDSVPDIGAIQQVLLTAGMSQTMIHACFSATWHAANIYQCETGAVCVMKCGPNTMMMDGLTGSARAVPGQGPCTDAQPQHSEADSSTQCVQHGEGPVYSHWTCIASVDMHFLFAKQKMSTHGASRGGSSL